MMWITWDTDRQLGAISLKTEESKLQAIPVGMQGGETFSTNTCCTWGVASNLVWAWHMEFTKCSQEAQVRVTQSHHILLTGSLRSEGGESDSSQ